MIQFFFFKRKWKQKKIFSKIFAWQNPFHLEAEKTKERGECAALLFVTLKGRSEIT